MISNLWRRRWVRIVCIVLAVLSVVGLVSGLASLRKPQIQTGVIEPNIINGIIPDVGERSLDYAKLYVQEGLVACYMAFSLESLSLDDEGKNYIWANEVKGGEAATLYGASYWQSMGGGIGYKMTFDQWTADADKVGCILPYDPEAMTENGGFNLEVVMAYDGITENGKRYFSEKPTYNKNKSAFRFGLLSTLSFVAESDASGESFMNRWFLTKRGYGVDYHNFVNFGNPPFITLESNSFDFIPTVMNGNITRFSCFTGFDESSNFYDIRMRYASVANTLEKEINTFVSAGQYNKVRVDTLTNQADKFSLFNGYPGRLYSVRVYEGRELTDAEKMRNYFVDLLAFHDINVEKIMTLSGDQLSALLTDCGIRASHLKITMNADKYGANRDLINQLLNSYK